jgi:cobalt-zinc-cadmium efflux system outer membrane protein
MALADRVAAEQASASLAAAESKPDVELLASYDSFWHGAAGRPLQWQVGARINLPVQFSRRNGAVAEAQAKAAERRAELARLTDLVNLQVQEAYEMLRESDKAIQLYEKKILPAAEANIKEARTSYVNGKIPFVSLIDAQRSLIGLKDRYYEVLAEAVRRRAALERAVGDKIDGAKN